MPPSIIEATAAARAGRPRHPTIEDWLFDAVELDVDELFGDDDEPAPDPGALAATCEAVP